MALTESSRRVGVGEQFQRFWHGAPMKPSSFALSRASCLGQRRSLGAWHGLGTCPKMTNRFITEATREGSRNRTKKAIMFFLSSASRSPILPPHHSLPTATVTVPNRSRSFSWSSMSLSRLLHLFQMAVVYLERPRRHSFPQRSIEFVPGLAHALHLSCAWLFLSLTSRPTGRTLS